MSAVSLLIVLAVCRLIVTAGHDMSLSWWSPAAYLWHDAAIVLGFAAVEWRLRGKPRAVAALYWVAVVYLAANIPVQRALSSPLTLPMWRAAGGPLADSIRIYLTGVNATLAGLVVAVGAAAPRLTRRIEPRLVLVPAAVVVAAGPLATARVDTAGRERNAWTALAESLTVRAPAAAGAIDWRESQPPRPADPDLAWLRGALRGRNVVLVSLESTAARYLGLYGAAVDVAPNLSALAASGVVFENAYAVYPESIKGLFSMLCSQTPAFDTAAESYTAVPCLALPAMLGQHGYRTALFHSGRFDYLGMNAIVRDRGYSRLADAGDIGGQHDSSFGIDEPSTVASILAWIDRGRGAPFFVTYLPIAGHHPYATPERGPFPDADEFGRYRNALHYGDAALGDLRRGLQSRGLDGNTVWILLGDHGEAFGQHDGNYGHTFQLYDENVRVPFVIAAPGALSRTIRARQVVSLLDTAPTVLDLLGIAPPREYQGASMLDGRSRLALFFTDYSLPLAGLRDGSRKAIHDLRSGRTRLFDLSRDPDERIDLSAQFPADTQRYAERLRRWIGASTPRP